MSYSKALFYKDDDILEIHPPSQENAHSFEGNIYFDIIEGRSVIQQQVFRGCTAACAAMLISDHDGKVNINDLKNSNLGNEESIREMMVEGGVSPFTSKIIAKKRADRLLQLQKYLLQDGPAIVSVNVNGGHVIIVDEISEDFTKVKIRDPYHGWMITIKVKAFLDSWVKRVIIQYINSQAERKLT